VSLNWKTDKPITSVDENLYAIYGFCIFCFLELGFVQDSQAAKHTDGRTAGRTGRPIMRPIRTTTQQCIFAAGKSIGGALENPSQSYGASPAIWDHITCHSTQMSAPSLKLKPSHTVLYSIYLTRRDRRLSWLWCVDYMPIWLTYPPTVNYSKYSNHLIATRPGIEPMTSRS